MAVQTLGKLKVALTFDGKAFQKGIKQAQNDTHAFAANMRRATDGINRVFVRGIQAATLALTGFGAASYKVGSDFENAMAFVGATANSTGKEMKMLEEEARNIGKATLFTARDAAKGMTEFARAGFTAGQIVAVTRPTMMLAGATMTDMATAAQGVAATLKQFGMAATETTRVTDVLSMATRKSLFNLSGLLTAMKYGGPMARAYGMNLEESVAAMMMFRNMGLEAHQAGVYFRMMLAKTNNVTPKAAGELRKYGLTTASISLETNNFAGVLHNLKDSVKDGINLGKVFGVRAGPIVQSLVMNLKDLNHEQDEWVKLTNQLNAATGTNEEMYMRVMDTVANQFTIAKSAFEELMLVIWNKYAPDLKDFAIALGESIRFVAEYLSDSKSLGSGLSGTIRGMTVYLRENQVALAQMVETAVHRLGQLLSIVIELAKWWKQIAAVMGAVFVFTKVFTFVQGLMSVVALLTKLGVTLAGITAGITAIASTAVAILPIALAIVAAVSALVGVLYATSEGFDQTESRLEELRANAAKEDRQQRVYNKERVKETIDYIAHLRDRLKAENKLTDVTEGHMRGLLALTDASAAQKEAEGELHKVTVTDGNKRREIYISTAVAMNMANDEVEEGIQLNNAMRRSVEAEEAALFKQQSTLKNLSSTYLSWRKAVDHPAANGGVWRAAEKAMKRYGTTMDWANAKIKFMGETTNATLKRVEKAYDSFNTHTVAIMDRQRVAVMQDAVAKGKKDEEQQKKWEKLQKKRIAFLEKIAKLELKLRKDLSVAINGNLVEARQALDQRLKDARDTYEKELDLYRKGSAKRIEIEMRMNASLNTIRKTALLESQKELQDVSFTAIENVKDFEADTEEKRLALKHKREMNALANLHAELQEKHLANEDELDAINLEASMARGALKVQQEAEIASIRKAAARDIEIGINDEIRQVQEAGWTEQSKLRVAFFKQMEELEKNNATDAQKKQARKLLKLKQQELLKEQNTTIAALRENGERGAKLELKALRAVGTKREKITRARAVYEGKLQAIERHRSELRTMRALGEIGGKEFRLAMAEANAAEKAAKREMKGARKEQTKKRLASIKKAVQEVAKALKAMGDAAFKAFGFFTDFNFDLKSQVSELATMVKEAGEKGAKVDFGAEAKSRVGGAIGDSVNLMETAVKAVPALISELGAQMPVLVQSFAENVPLIVKGFADNIGPLMSAIVEAVPVIIQSLLSALPDIIAVAGEFITQIILMLPELVEGIAAQLPALITALVEAIGPIIVALTEAVPQIVMALVEAIPMILEALFSALPVLVPALIDLALTLVLTIIEAIPLIVEGFFAALPALITGIISMIPKIIISLISMLPKIAIAIISLIPMIVIKIIQALPQIVTALITGIFTQLIPMIPKMVVMILKSLIQALVDGLEKIGQAIGDIFRSKKGRERAKERRAKRDAEKEQKREEEFLDGFDAESFYSGISYVPANMRVQVHQGEAIIPADRNPAAGGSHQARAGADSSSVGQSIDIAIMAEGRLLDAVQVTAMDRGNAPGITERLTRASGVTVGLDRGRFDYWGR